MFSFNDRVRLAPPFDRTSNEVGTVIGFVPSQTPESEQYVIVRWDDGTEARFAPGALVPVDDQ